MVKKLTKSDLDSIETNCPAAMGPYIKVGMSSCGIAAGAQGVFDLLRAEAEKKEIDIPIKQCGCSGACYAEPLVEVAVEGMPTVTYGNVTEEVALRIIDEHVAERRMVHDCIVDLPGGRGARP
jgi:(2Fe-2S) ferredoxin